MPNGLFRIGAAAALLGALTVLAIGPIGCVGKGVSTSASASLAATPAAAATFTPPASSPASSAPTTSTPTTATPKPSAQPKKIVFAVVGDYGVHRAPELAVAKLIKSWKASFVVTVGDNYYLGVGGKGNNTYYNSAGWAYGKWMADVPKHGKHAVAGSKVNAFFPVLGNEDYNLSATAKNYRTYFTLPGEGFANSSGNERYYDFTTAGVHFFMLDSDPHEPKGVSAKSAQARWLKNALASSEASWNVVVEHHPPYTSCVFGESPYMRWPYKKWGADLVLSGHAHVYERVQTGGMTYVVDGVGGSALHPLGSTISGSQVRYNSNWGAIRCVVQGNKLTLEFRNLRGTVIDRFSLTGRK